jgi:hypothetical protein
MEKRFRKCLKDDSCIHWRKLYKASSKRKRPLDEKVCNIILFPELFALHLISATFRSAGAGAGRSGQRWEAASQAGDLLWLRRVGD